MSYRLVTVASLSALLAACTSSTPATSSSPDLATSAASGCTTDRDCPVGQRCDAAAHACFTCVSDADCPAGEVCRNHACGQGCSTDKGCGDAGLCNLDAGVCIECSQDADCRDPDRRRCDGTTNRCMPCLPANDNCGSGTYCSAAQGGSYACTSGCKDDQDCRGADAGTIPDGGAGARCDTTSHRCVNCSADADCPANTICKDVGQGPTCIDGCSDTKPCQTPQACCGAACVDVRSDPMNCGGCGTACPGGWACCNSTCANPSSDTMNCGGCGNTCQVAHGAPRCASRSCAVGSCDPGWANCNGSADDGCETHVDVNADNCGACANKCAVPNALPGCQGGACTVGTCLYPFADCDGQAGNGCETNTGTDLTNCGGCGDACSVSHGTPACKQGACAVVGCDPGFADCDHWAGNGCETALASDPWNCGACNDQCRPINGAPACLAGVCHISCLPGFGDCDGNPAMTGCETSLLTDVKNCGACSAACSTSHATPACDNGACKITKCDAGWADCNGDPADGCETNLAADPANCGSCGVACSGNHATPACTAGACTSACDAGWSDCNANLKTDGCETHTDADLSNCGQCANACPAVANGTGACTTGICTIASCNQGYADCDQIPANGCEVNTQTDANNCGGCGTVCPQNQSCQSGACQAHSCLDNAQWMPVQCTYSSWEWSSDRNFRSPAAANAAHTLQTGCRHVGIPNVAQGLCSIDGTGWISTATFTMSGCDTNWEHINVSGDLGNCGGHDGDLYRHLVVGDNDCYAY